MKLTLRTPSDFDFCSAASSHGFFMLAPNVWDPAHKVLGSAITVDDATAVGVVIAPSGDKLLIRIDHTLPAPHADAVRAGVCRMLRLDEDLSPFHALCAACETHRDAAKMRFGRLLRSPTFFEDIVKVICTCNITWRQTVSIVERLVDLWGVPLSTQHSAHSALKGFPTPARLASAGVAALKRQARLGYRAEFVHRLAADVAEGRLDLGLIEQHAGSSDELFKRLRSIHGIGPYAAAHLCGLLGHYDHLAVDTEMVRMLRERYPRRRFTPASIARHYRRWHPYESLAYWFELWQGYIERHGASTSWTPEGVGREITATK